jgi:hypothetical protein
MENYWLSDIDYQKSVIKNIKEAKSKPDPEDDQPEDDSEDASPKSNLEERQQMMYENYESVVEMHGMFDQSSKASGSHYAPGELNPFKQEGLICGNCVFFQGGGGCEIVSGKIDPNGICKLWIIPQELVKRKK